METNIHKPSEKDSATDNASGNIMVYVLIGIALIGILTMVMTRQANESDDQDVDSEVLELRVSKVLSYAATAKNVVEQMVLTGTDVSSLDFTLPSEAAFDSSTDHIDMVFHTEGGGLSVMNADSNIFTGTGSDPDAGWYVGLFNDVEWTTSTSDDVILVAHQISEAICEQINKKITGSTTIPALAGTGLIADYLIDDTDHTGTNAQFSSTVCASCDGYPSLCVSNSGGTMWSYYSILQMQ